jgi:uncharacterized membrane protein
MGLVLLVGGLALFIGGHLITTMRARRAALIDRLGQNLYLGLYSLVAAAGLALVAYGFARYRVGGWVDVWHPPQAMRQVAIWLPLPAIVLMVASYVRGRIYTTLKHPMLIGVAVWAVAHLLANGDLGSIILFGGLLGWALYDLWTLRGRTDPGAPPIPVGGRANDAIAIVAGVVVYLALAVVFHPLVIGVSVFGG